METERLHQHLYFTFLDGYEQTYQSLAGLRGKLRSDRFREYIATSFPDASKMLEQVTDSELEKQQDLDPLINGVVQVALELHRLLTVPGATVPEYPDSP